MRAIDILEKIEDNGFEAYIVGGYVRDHVLGYESNDIDICTNARVKDILNIFNDVNAYSDYYGNVKIITNKAVIDITTYRRDLRYNGDRKKVEIEYVDNLLDDIKRRDFTMNTLCMNKDGSIIDLMNGQDDIKNKVIRCVGSIEERITEDPLRMLRAVRFATILGFKIDDELYEELKNHKELIEQLSMERIKEELTKILVSKNALVGLEIFRDLGYLPYLGIEYNRVVNVDDICGMYSQLEFSKDYPFTKEERELIKNIKNILSYGKIDKNILFDYGLYVSIVAGSILGVDRETITSMDAKMEIKSTKDIRITSEEICGVLGVEPSKIIRIVYDDLKNMILNGRLENENNSIREYILDNRKKW
ncbi:MAG: hypothetical protein IJ475_02855 [Bacilli bacterium]|nr:hypothetical protein [Bacilli bacterium]